MEEGADALQERDCKQNNAVVNARLFGQCSPFDPLIQPQIREVIVIETNLFSPSLFSQLSLLIVLIDPCSWSPSQFGRLGLQR